MLRFLIPLIAIIAVTAVWVWPRITQGRSPAEVRASQKEAALAARLLARSVRLLEAGLNDPMYRQSAEWTEVAREIVDDYNEGD